MVQAIVPARDARVVTSRSGATGDRRSAARIAARTKGSKAESLRLVRVKPLDPCARCGPGTSVEHLYRVEEHVEGRATVHLVFFDRHGWYCVHGPSCVAVRDVHAELRAQRQRFPAPGARAG